MTNDLHPDDLGGGDDGNDGDIVTLVRSAGLETDPTFVADLRATLLTEADTTDDDINVISLTPNETDGPADTRTTRRWPLLAAAAAVLAVGIGAIALVSQRGDDSAIITDDPPRIGDTIDDPVAFLDGSTWVAIGRFDAFASSRTPVFTADSDGAILLLTGNDGCRPVSLEVTFDGGTVASVAGVPAEPCDDERATPYIWSVGDRLDETDDGGFVVVRNGEALVEFADPDELAAATVDDLVGEWLLDRLAPVTIDADRFELGFWGCVRAVGYAWSIDGGVLTVDGLRDDFQQRCDPPPGEFLTEDAEARLDVVEVIGGETIARRVGDDVVLVGGDRGVRLRALPSATPDPAGITIAAGSAFGIQPGFGVGPDDVVAAVTPHLGDPSFDSGWVDADRSLQWFPTCVEGLLEYRELWWGDLSFAFGRRGGQFSLDMWWLGDRGVGPQARQDVGAPADPTPTGLATEDGVVVGGSVDSVAGIGVDRRDMVDAEGEAFIVVASADGAGFYYLVDDRVTGFGREAGCG